MLLDIKNLYSFKLDIRSLSAKERIQLIYSLVYFGYSLPYMLSFIRVHNITREANFLYIPNDRSIEYGVTKTYFERYSIPEIKNPKDLIIKDIVMTSFFKTPNGMFINDHRQCREIKLNKDKVLSCRTNNIHDITTKFLNIPVVYSRSLNSYMIENICKGI